MARNKSIPPARNSSSMLSSDDESEVGSNEHNDSSATSIPSVDYIFDRVVPCVAQLAVVASNDAVWKTLNLAVLMLTRETSPRVRIAALKALRKCFTMVGEEYLVMLPESLSFLSELLEDRDPAVEGETRSILKFVEDLSGEELELYL